VSGKVADRPHRVDCVSLHDLAPNGAGALRCCAVAMQDSRGAQYKVRERGPPRQS